MRAGQQYRADIDGLRAVAVLGVVLFHGGLGFPGGFAGVDVFFVISGFLITGLILKDLEHGSFSMVDFWERRIRRIFPALFVMVLVCLVAGWFLLLPYGYLVLGQSAFTLSLFASNIQFWRTTDYFSPLAEENPLLHTWSLSVEEQFYLIIPLLLAGLYAWRQRRLLFPVLVVITTASFAVSVVWLERDPSGAFYLLPSRAWELGVGALLAFVPALRSNIWRNLAFYGGLMSVFSTFVFYQPGAPFPGLAALPPVIGTALVIWSGVQSCGRQLLWGQRLLGSKPLIWCGLISYSLYLWHWPFFAFHRYIFDHFPPAPVSIVYIAAAFVISVLSLRYVERPFRQKSLCRSRRSIFVFFLAGTGLVLGASLTIYLSGGLASRLPADVLRLDRVEGNNPYQGKLRESLAGGTEVYEIGVADTPPEVLLWGDSHAGVLLSVMDEVCRDADVSGRAVIRGRTPPMFGWSGERETTAEHMHALSAGRIVEEMLQIGSIRVAFLAFRWSYYVRRVPPLDPSRVPLPGFEEALLETITKLQKLGVQVVLLEEVPIFPGHVPRRTALASWIGVPELSLLAAEAEKFRKPYGPVMARLRSLEEPVALVDPVPLLTKNGRIDFRDEQGLYLWRDQHHLTRHATQRLAPALREALLRSLSR
jgi:peptidoglycan/LPS O-acetylase OafA/YrhL